MTINKTEKLQVITFFTLLVFGIALIWGGGYFSAVRKGLDVWLVAILPTVFPYAFITACLARLKITAKITAKASKLTTRLFNTGGATACAFFISVISGYPLGAKTVADLKKGGLLSDAESQRASAFCSNASPVYMITGVGAVALSNKLLGAILFLSNLLSAIAVGIIFRFYEKNSKPSPVALSPIKCDNLFYESVFTSVTSTLVLCGTTVLFTVITEILSSFGLLNFLTNALSTVFQNTGLAKGVTLGFFECSLGVREITAVGLNFWTLPLCGLLCGFGGLSCIFSCVGFLKESKIKIAPFLFSKILHAILNFLICLLFNPLFI